jgi:hypothetical protein
MATQRHFAGVPDFVMVLDHEGASGERKTLDLQALHLIFGECDRGPPFFLGILVFLSHACDEAMDNEAVIGVAQDCRQRPAVRPVGRNLHDAAPIEKSDNLAFELAFHGNRLRCLVRSTIRVAERRLG